MHLSVVVMTFFALALSCLANSASAQSRASYIHQSTTPPTDGRFEIVQSQLAVKWTFRLDRYTGHVDQLVETQDNELTWEELPVEGLPAKSNSDRPRFVVFKPPMVAVTSTTAILAFSNSAPSMSAC